MIQPEGTSKPQAFLARLRENPERFWFMVDKSSDSDEADA